MRGCMEKDVVCCSECPRFGGCLIISVLTVISVWCPLFKMVCTWRKNQHLCVRIYHQHFGLCLMALDFLFLKFRTILLCTLTTKTVFLQTAKNSSHKLQEMQSTCQAQTTPIIRSQKARSMTSSVISNFQKIRKNFWHQGYNSVIYFENFKIVFWEISKLQISENLYKILWIHMNNWGVLYRWKCTFYFHIWISFH